MIFSVDDVTRTRLCAARDCDGDAMTGHAICDRCARRQRQGKRIVLHEIEQPTPIDENALLSCVSCDEPKPDADFSRSHSPRYRYRRNRHAECRECAAKRRRAARPRTNTPKCAAIVTRDKWGKPLDEARRCLAWVREGTAYCVVHQPKENT